MNSPRFVSTSRIAAPDRSKLARILQRLHPPRHRRTSRCDISRHGWLLHAPSGPKISGSTKVSFARASSRERRRVCSVQPKRCAAYNSSYLCLPGIGRRPAGRAVGCAQAPQAGLSPRGLPSLTRRPGTSATANPIGSSSQVLGSGPLMNATCTPSNASNGNDNVAKQLRVVRKTAFVDVVHTDDVVLAVEHGRQ